MHWADLALMIAVFVAGCAGTYFLASAKLRRVMAENHREMDRRLAALTEAIAMGAPASSDTVHGTEALSATEIEPETSAGTGSLPDARDAAVSAESVVHEDAEVPTEIQAAIAAAAITAFGNHARVVSARRVPSTDVVSPWTQQGRLIVQSSHNLRTRR